MLPRPVRYARSWMKVAPSLYEDTAPSPTPAYLRGVGSPSSVIPSAPSVLFPSPMSYFRPPLSYFRLTSSHSPPGSAATTTYFSLTLSYFRLTPSYLRIHQAPPRRPPPPTAARCAGSWVKLAPTTKLLWVEAQWVYTGEKLLKYYSILLHYYAILLCYLIPYGMPAAG